MELPVPSDCLMSLVTWDPFCAQEAVQILQAAEPACGLDRIGDDLQLRLQEQALPCTLTHDLLSRNIPLKARVAPDVVLWSGHLDPVGKQCS